LRTCLSEGHAGGELRSGVTDNEVLDDFIVPVEGATLPTLPDRTLPDRTLP
jgi:hypothetical protein